MHKVVSTAWRDPDQGRPVMQNLVSFVVRLAGRGLFDMHPDLGHEQVSLWVTSPPEEERREREEKGVPYTKDQTVIRACILLHSTKWC
jgi:hypothetical protein